MAEGSTLSTRVKLATREQVRGAGAADHDARRRTRRCATSASLPTGMPSSSSRSVSAIGVTGWCSAIQRGRRASCRRGRTRSTRTARRRRRTCIALAASTLLASRPKHAASQEIAVISASSRPATASQSSGPGLGAEAGEQRDADHEQGRDDVARDAGGDVAGQHRGGGDRQRAEAVDHAGGHVERDGDRGARRAEARAQDDDPGDDVVDVAAAGVDRAAEDVDEHQQDRDGQHDRGQQRVDAADAVAQAAADEGQRVGHVSARKTSSRVGLCSSRRSIATPSRVCEDAADVVRAVGGHAQAEAVGVAADAGSARRRGSRRRRRTARRVSSPTRALSSCGGALRGDAAVVDDRDPVREAVGLLEVLGGEQDRRALVGERLHGLPDREPAARVQARGRLVEEDHLGLGDQAHRQVEPAPHAAAVGGDAAVGGLGEVEALEQLVA